MKQPTKVKTFNKSFLFLVIVFECCVECLNVKSLHELKKQKTNRSAISNI